MSGSLLGGLKGGNALFQFRAEVSNESLDWPGSGVTLLVRKAQMSGVSLNSKSTQTYQRTNRVSLNLF